MAMLHIMSRIKMLQEPSLDLFVVHFNHKLRKESDEESAFVQSMCDRLGVPCTLETMPAELHAKIAKDDHQGAHLLLFSV